MRVTIARLADSGNIVKACEDWDAFEHWFENYCQMERDELSVVSCHVYELE